MKARQAISLSYPASLSMCHCCPTAAPLLLIVFHHGIAVSHTAAALAQAKRPKSFLDREADGAKGSRTEGETQRWQRRTLLRIASINQFRSWGLDSIAFPFLCPFTTTKSTQNPTIPAMLHPLYKGSFLTSKQTIRAALIRETPCRTSSSQTTTFLRFSGCST